MACAMDVVSPLLSACGSFSYAAISSSCSSARMCLAAISGFHPEGLHAGLTYRFCSRCGIRLYATGELPQLGGRFYALHVPTLDDVDREELVSAPLNFVDNAHDRPDRAPIDTRLT